MVKEVHEGQTVWVTNYALSRGVLKCEMRPTTWSINPRPFKDGRCVPTGWDLADVFDNEAEAVADAEAKRIKALGAAKRRVAKLETLRFTPEGGGE